MQPTYDQTDPTSPAGSIPHWIDPVRETDLVARRRTVHRTPETGWAEFIATARAAEFFTSLGFKVMVGREFIDPIYVRGRSEAEVSESERLAKAAGVSPVLLQRMGGLTGLCATFDTGHPGKTLAFRVELDALKMNEPVDPDHIPYREGFASERPGLMHACGHDAHTATGVTLAHWITDHTDELKGRFRLIFQPAEEGTRGAAPMAAAGVVDDLNWFFGAHVGCNCRIGEASVVKKGFLATTKIDIEFTGVPSHAGSDPEKGRSALMAAAAAAVMMQGIPRHGEGDTRIAVGRLVAGEGRNVTPVHAVMQCETRGSTQEINEYMFESVRRIVEGCAASYGVECRVTKAGEATNFEATPAACDLAVEACVEVFGGDHVTSLETVGGSEDCSILARRAIEHGAEATFLFYGCNHHGHHRADFEIQDTQSLPAALAVLSGICRRTNGL